jgi:hypothetical protein
MSAATVVKTSADLLEAIKAGAMEIEVQGTLHGMPMITLNPGVSLRGGTLQFGAKGVRLTRDNTLEGVTVRTAEQEVAILNDTSVSDLGVLALRDVRATGQVLLLAAETVRGGRVVVDGLTIDRADLRGRVERPHGFGVDAMQGAFTLWNRQADPDVTITAELSNISAGLAETPVRGSGVFVGGHGNWTGFGDGGRLQVSTLSTGEIHADGGIPVGTPDLISGGVFVISGAVVEQVVNNGPVTTYGQNDMVLDNWGTVQTWTATAPVTSKGPSGIGFVNFGAIDRLDVQAPIQTFGSGARGFNHYDGSLRHASFQSLATHADGAIGIQVSKPMSILEIAGDLTTEGGEAQSLVRGVQMPLKAIALSVKPDGKVDKITVGGRIQTSGDNVVTVEIEGHVGEISVAGVIVAAGSNSDAIHVRGDVAGLDRVKSDARHGKAIVHAR